MDLILIAFTPIALAQVMRKRLKAEWEAIAATLNRMEWRNGGLLQQACEELWYKLYAACQSDPGSSEVSVLIAAFRVRLELLGGRVFLGRGSRAELNGPVNDLARVLKAHGIRLIAPLGEATDGKRLLYAVAMPTVSQPVGSRSPTASSQPTSLAALTPERVLN